MTTSDQRQPSEMAARRIFSSAGSAVGDTLTARLGELKLPGRKPITTPNFSGVASRGVIPHLTPDNVAAYTSIGSAYMGLEDFIEKNDPPIYQTPSGDVPALHRFTAFPQQLVTILGARRCPAVTPPLGNTAKVINIFTSTGFRSISVPKYAQATSALQPDIVVAPADLLHTARAPASKRQLKMAERTEEWVDEFIQGLNAGNTNALAQKAAVFAPILPVEHGIQWAYLKHLSEDILSQISGLAIYDINMLPDLGRYAIGTLPRLSLDPPQTPREVLRQVSLGVDICLAPFVNTMSDAGVALTFTFPPPETDQTLPLGIDMWASEFKASLAPIQEGCGCYSCQKHHRAFINHLLNAKEMLGWNLLQIHNHHVLSQFFKGIQETLAEGPAKLDELISKFSAAYELDFPAGTGERPRARGYHFKTEAHQEKFNKPGWQDLDKAVAPVNDAVETPTVPTADGQTLAENGFADKQI